jgi:hypothetical protein
MAATRNGDSPGTSSTKNTCFPGALGISRSLHRCANDRTRARSLEFGTRAPRGPSDRPNSPLAGMLASPSAAPIAPRVAHGRSPMLPPIEGGWGWIFGRREGGCQRASSEGWDPFLARRLWVISATAMCVHSEGKSTCARAWNGHPELSRATSPDRSPGQAPRPIFPVDNQPAGV